MKGFIRRSMAAGIILLSMNIVTWAADSACISNVKEKVEQITSQANDLGVGLGGVFPYAHYSPVYIKKMSAEIIRERSGSCKKQSLSPRGSFC